MMLSPCRPPAAWARSVAVALAAAGAALGAACSRAAAPPPATPAPSAPAPTDRCAVAADSAAARHDTVTVAATEPVRVDSTCGPAVRVYALPRGGDPRDALDLDSTAAGGGRPPDLLVTRDAAALAYARSRSDLHTMPLPWDRTYVLVTPAPIAMGTGPADDPAALRASLARDAVRGDARGAEPPFWWEGDPRCVAADSGASRTPAAQVVYPRGDATARELAERVVALTGGLRSAALDSAALERSIAAGAAAGYVVPLPRMPPSDCAGIPRWTQGAAVLPLVDSRAHAIARRATRPFTVDSSGTIRFAPAAP